MTFEFAGQPGHIAGSVDPGHVVTVSGEVDSILAACLPGVLLESLAAWSVSDDQQVSILGGMSEQFDGPDQVVDSFLSCESSDYGHEGCIVRQVELVADFASQAGKI